MIDKTKYKFADIIFTLYNYVIFYTCISPIVPNVSDIQIYPGRRSSYADSYAFWLSVGYVYMCPGAYVCMAPTQCLFWREV